ncbi:hypothetical protein [Mesorhizobium sp. BHbdii]
MKSNIVAFLNVLEGCWQFGIDHLVYASSSPTIPFSEHHGAASRLQYRQ